MFIYLRWNVFLWVFNISSSLLPQIYHFHCRLILFSWINYTSTHRWTVQKCLFKWVLYVSDLIRDWIYVNWCELGLLKMFLSPLRVMKYNCNLVFFKTHKIQKISLILHRYFLQLNCEWDCREKESHPSLNCRYSIYFLLHILILRVFRFIVIKF